MNDLNEIVETDFFENVNGTEQVKRYPNSPGSKSRAPETSKAAAVAIRPDARSLRSAVLSQLKRANNLTADEIASNLGESVLSIRPRVAELHALARIADSGIRRKNQSGRYAVAWRVA